MPSITHQLDANAAWENLALEACDRGIATHGWKDLTIKELRQKWAFLNPICYGDDCYWE